MAYKNLQVMKAKWFVIATVLALFVQGVGFGQTPEAEIFYNRGKEYLENGDYSRAMEEYNRAIRLKPDYAAAINDLGEVFFYLYDYANAETYFLEAKTIREKVPGKEHPDYVDSLNNLGTLYYHMGNYERAERNFLEAAAIRGRIIGKEHPDYAESLNTLGLLYHYMGYYERAERYYLEAAAILEKSLGKMHPDYAASLNNLGGLYWNMGDYKRAEQYHLESLAIRERTLGKEHPDNAYSLNNLGALYDDMGDYKRAERYYLEATAIREKSLGKEHPEYASSLDNLGLLYYNLGDYERAERYFLEAMAIKEKSLGKEHPDYAISLINLGALYDDMGNYKRAERYYLEATAIWEKTLGKEHPFYASSLNNLGALYRNMNDNARAERYYLEARAVREMALGKEHPDYVTSLDNLYALYLDKREYSKAATYKLEAYKINTTIINRNFSFLSEQQRSSYWDMNSSSFESTYSLPWHHPVPESKILGYDNALFTKGLLLRTTNAVRDSIYASGNQRLIAQFEELGRKRQQISALQQSGGDEEYIRTLEAEAEALDKSLTQASAAFREFQADLAMDWQNVRNSLQANEAAIEFVSFRIYDKGWTGKTQYAALVLRPGMAAPEWVPLCEETTLAGLFGKLGNLTSREQAQILYDEYGPELYAAVWQPLEKVLEGVGTVYYSPSGLLHKVSFNAIPVNGATRLMDAYNLNLVSSTREVVYLRNRSAKAVGSAAVYGGLQYDADPESMRSEARAYSRSGPAASRDADFGFVDPSEYLQKTSGELKWGYLRYTDLESRVIYDQLTTNKIPSSLLNGVKGNKESFKDLSGRKTAVIHLATHGFFNQDVEKNYDDRIQQMGGSTQKAVADPLQRSGLILSGANTWTQNPVEGAESGVLLASEVAGLNLLGAELVVLSACETALGEVDNSEGVFGLQRAFKLAGAQTLVMSLWKVDDEATSLMISTFYRNWLSGKSRQEAMKEAQRQMRAERRYASPYYWAAFVLMD